MVLWCFTKSNIMFAGEDAELEFLCKHLRVDLTLPNLLWSCHSYFISGKNCQWCVLLDHIKPTLWPVGCFECSSLYFWWHIRYLSVMQHTTETERVYYYRQFCWEIDSLLHKYSLGLLCYIFIWQTAVISFRLFISWIKYAVPILAVAGGLLR